MTNMKKKICCNKKILFRYEPIKKDIPKIKSLLISTGFFSNPEISTAIELISEKLHLGNNSSYQFILALKDEILIGYSCYGLIPLTESSFDLYWIAVDPAFHGKGIGKLILKNTEEKIKEAHGTRIYVDTSSRKQYMPTRNFYKSCAYKKAGYFPDFYSKGDGKIIFTKKL